MITEFLTWVVSSVPWWIRLSLTVFFFVLAVVMLVVDGIEGAVVFGIVGFVLLLFCGRTNSEKNGYNF
jgi:hypothetical protein